jgi:hypothetical protein
MATQQAQVTQSSTLVVVNPVIRRLRSCVGQLSGFVMSNGTDHQRRMHRVLNIIIDESMDELAEMDEMSLAVFLHNMACITEWLATGDMGVLPEELIPFACHIEGVAMPVKVEPVADDSDIVDGEIVEVPALPAPSYMGGRIEELWPMSVSLLRYQGNVSLPWDRPALVRARLLT